ncbi:6-phosphogluconate dehydrogenase NAD-binding protein [Kribbella flavida DSM 17836]|uniref:6-phosphogluconate dehydrogenase NAD-binding protein n=1 Tax=Kribbella flavida (strain DSM 17836 / JCM 10339 / NBRC 14399) TaxID=479435 RepID=D2PWW9_KRIFD|nr:NAD(P)-binding domain-containing protein [Kribbella flavida]ADB35349.1 6-phosphogluconate dehydrogenase NAD-binding protein [Kribbella flavida DSM 17836]
MTDHSRTPVTVLGLGPMGQALAAAFLAAEHPTTVWNRTPGKGDQLAAQGATVASTAAEAAAASGLIVVCVLDYDAVEQILAAAEPVLAGRTVVNLTADSPDRARQTAQWAAERGIQYLDGAIMTPTETIGGPEAVVLYSGPKDLYAGHAPALAALGGTQSHLGEDPGRAAAHDVALLGIFWTALTGIMHAFALAKAENIAARDLAGFARGITDLLSPSIDGFAANIDAGEHPGTTTNLLSAAAGIAHIVHASEQHGIDAGLLRAAHALTRQAIADGHGTDEFTRLTDTLLRHATR